ncbi:MAG: hypothetical protein WC799_03185 [Desulfobacteraceae bacterium]|jgi:hypothetical protein
MYISHVPFERLGFIHVPDKPTPKLSEKIQHSLFSYLWSPIALYTLLSSVMWVSKRKEDRAESTHGGEA